MAVSSYLSDVAGGMVVGGSFSGEAPSSAALDLLASSGVRPQDISVICRDQGLAADERFNRCKVMPHERCLQVFAHHLGR